MNRVDLFDAARGRVTIETNASPPIALDPFGAPGGKVVPYSSADGEGSGLGGFVLRLLQPRITVQLAGSSVSLEPWGRPDWRRGALVALAVVVVVVVVARS